MLAQLWLYHAVEDSSLLSTVNLITGRLWYISLWTAMVVQGFDVLTGFDHWSYECRTQDITTSQCLITLSV